MGIVSAALGALWFGAGGVIAGSLAAGWQAGLGNVVAGSVFSAAQSVGAAGVGWAGAATGAAAGATGAAAAGTGYLTSGATLANCGWVVYLLPIILTIYMITRE